MADTWTTPATYAVGDVYTAATVNLYVRDNTSWLGSDKPKVHVYTTNSQSVATSTVTPIQFGAELYDNRGIHSTTYSNSKIIIPSGMGGLYIMTGVFSMVQSGTGYQTAAWRFNGTPTYEGRSDKVANAGVQLSNIATYMVEVPAGEYFELIAFQTSGGPLNVLADSDTFPCAASAVWLQTI